MASDVSENELEAIAAVAVAFAETTDDESVWRASLVEKLRRLRRVDPAIVRAASQRISQLPNPPDIDVDEFENAETVYEMFRLPSPASELADALKAREWMDRLATDLENA